MLTESLSVRFISKPEWEDFDIFQYQLINLRHKIILHNGYFYLSEEICE